MRSAAPCLLSHLPSRLPSLPSPAGDSLSYGELKEATKLPDEDLTRCLASLTLSKYKLLAKVGGARRWQAGMGRQAGGLEGVGGGGWQPGQGRARGQPRPRCAGVAGIRAGAHTTQADLNTKSTTTLPRASQPCPHPHPHPHSIPTPTHLPLPLAPQEAASKGIGPADSFRINPKFTDRMRRIRVGGRQGACLPHMHHAERMQSGCSCCAPGVDPSSSNSGVKRPLIQTPPPPRPPASCLRAARRCRCRLWTTARRFRRMWTR